jgi:hypothetical protein
VPLLCLLAEPCSVRASGVRLTPPPPGRTRRAQRVWAVAPHARTAPPPHARGQRHTATGHTYARGPPRRGCARRLDETTRKSVSVPWQTLARVRWSVWSALPLAAALEPQPASSAWTRTRCARRCRSRWTPVPCTGAAGRAGGGGAWGEIVCRRPAPDADRAPCRGSVKKERFPLRTTQSLRRVHAATALGPANMWGGGCLEDTLGPWTP